MIFKKLSLTISALLFSTCYVYAGCAITMSDGIKKPSETYSFCKNTFPSPKYQVSWYSSIEENDFLMLFNFDPIKTSISCKDFEVNGKAKSSCIILRKDLFGKIKIPKVYENKNSDVYMIDLNSKSNLIRDIKKAIKNNKLIYKSANTVEDLEDSDCFAGINVNEKSIYLGYKTSNLTSLGYCIQGMESWISKNFKSIRSMVY